MRKLLLNISIALLTVVALSTSAHAAGETTFSGFVDMSYFSDPNSDTATFGMDQAELDIVHNIDGKASLRMDLEYTDTGDGGGADADTVNAAIEQGFITINAGANVLTFGKFNAPIGWELLDAPDMYQFSHAMVFDFGLPTNLTGAMISGSSGVLDISVYYVNGWDNNTDDNTDKHIGTRIGITPNSTLNIGLSYISGDINLTPTNKVTQTITDIDLTYTPSEQLTVGAEYNIGTVKEASNVDAGDAKWNGYLVMAHFDFNDTHGLTLRYDSFTDEDGYRLSTLEETRTAMTAAWTFGIADGLGGLIEWKNTKSDKEPFTDKDGNPKDSESTLAAELTFSF